VARHASDETDIRNGITGNLLREQSLRALERDINLPGSRTDPKL